MNVGAINEGIANLKEDRALVEGPKAWSIKSIGGRRSS